MNILCQTLNFMRQLITTSFLLLTICNRISGQTKEPINTDRPDQSDGTYTMPKKNLQLETGFIYGKNEENYFTHDIMLRYGITSSTEVRLLFDYGKIASETGIFAPGISVKQHLISQRNWLPEITAVGYLRLPFLATTNFKTDNPATTFLFAFQNIITDKFSIGYNFGTTFDGDHPYENWIVTASLGFTATKRISFFAEYFASFAKVIQPSNNVDTGVLWLLNNNFQIDLAIGSTIYEQDKNKFITTGISYRF